MSDIQAARAEFVDRGVDVSEVFHRAGPGKAAFSGRDPARRTYSSFATFGDPDGNSWLSQEITVGLPGSVEGDVATFTSLSELALALRRARRRRMASTRSGEANEMRIGRNGMPIT